MTVPGLKIGVVILSNQEIVGLSAILWFIVGQYIGIENYDRSQQFFEWYSKYIDHKKEQIEELENNRIKGTKPSLKLKDFAGTYYDEMYGDLTISIENKMLKLSFQHSHSFTADLEHYHFNTFRLKWHDPTLPEGLILFNINSKNKISGFEFDIPRLLDADFKELYIKRKN